MSSIPDSLRSALRPITVVCGHYGVGKTNFSVNLACDLAAEGATVTLIDLDVVNPYFRASEQREGLEAKGVRLISPVFAEKGTSLDVPSLTGAIEPALADVADDEFVIVDLGGDDVGAAAIGRFAKTANARGLAMLYVLNRHRYLVSDPAEAVEILREIEAASHLTATALVDNAHLGSETTLEALLDEEGYAQAVGDLCGLPLVAKTYPAWIVDASSMQDDGKINSSSAYAIHWYVRSPWDEDGERRECNGEDDRR